MSATLKIIVLAVAFLSLLGCSTMHRPGAVTDFLVTDAESSPPTMTRLRNADLPPPREPVDVAAYAFTDQTGQNKEADGYSDFSRAVTQGGTAILIEALKEAGNGKWFRVVERASLNNLLQERNIIDQMRRQYEGRSSTLPALRFAGILIEGGVVGYDTNQLTGGQGARFLGIGVNQQYRQDVVTVTLRTVSVATGEVLTSETTTKTAYSILGQGNLFQFVVPVNNGEILELESGYTQNEPITLVVRQAIEFAVYSMIINGAREDLWHFADRAKEKALIEEFDRRYNSLTKGEQRAYQRRAAAPVSVASGQ